MANTFELIASSTAGSGGAVSFDFTSIPSTYTDLCLQLSVREATSASAVVNITFNGLTTNRSERYLQGNGSAASSGTTTVLQVISAQPTDTASTFGSATIYIPNYAGSTNKSVSSDSVSENNATSAFSRLSAGLWANTAAINQITIATTSGNLAQYSTAYLYGVKNA
jgi:cystathionine beta-lyase/cystathionine gamma-synthase